MPPEPRLAVVADHANDGRLSAALGDRATPGSGIVVVQPAPRAHQPWHLVDDLLSALGKRSDAAERESLQNRERMLLRVWLAAERVRELVVLDAHRLHVNLWELVIRYTEATGSRIWMVARGALEDDQLAVAGLQRPHTPAELLARLPLTTLSPERAALARHVRWPLTPAIACAMVFAAVTGLTTDALCRLRVSNLPHGALVLVTRSRSWRIPEELRAPVRAQITCRASQPAQPFEAFIAQLFGQFASPASVSHWVEQVVSPHPLPRVEEPWPLAAQRHGYRFTVRGVLQRWQIPDVGCLAYDFPESLEELTWAPLR